MNPYASLIPRLNGTEIEERFDYYLGLVKKGVAGFIIFGGKLETVRTRLKELRDASDHPLIIASDLEQGLGQQIKGGTLFPPAMAVASALKAVPKKDAASILQKLYTAFSMEAGYAGINTILAPVLDINTNPDNPIISTRAFGEDPETVSYFGCEMVRILQHNKIMACGKHFPGHGDTEIDSHMSLPVIKKDLSVLENHEFVPFRRAIREGVNMIMLGHLSVPSIEPSGKPASISERIVLYLRNKMGFKGLVITDAMNMGALGGYHETEASIMALNSGIDLILHPTDPDEIASYLQQKNFRAGQNPPLPPFAKGGNILSPPLKKGDLGGFSSSVVSPEDITLSFDFSEHRKLSEKLTNMAITVEGEDREVKKPFLIILNEDKEKNCQPFVNTLRERFQNIKYCMILNGEEILWHVIPQGHELIVAIFSPVKAWKGKTTRWLLNTIKSLDGKARILISFGNPYVIKDLADVIKIYAYWDSESAQKAVAEKLINFPRKNR